MEARVQATFQGEIGILSKLVECARFSRKGERLKSKREIIAKHCRERSTHRLANRAVRARIFGMRWSDTERQPVRIRGRCIVAVRIRRANRGDWPPEIVRVFRVENSARSIISGHVYQRKGARAVHQ